MNAVGDDVGGHAIIGEDRTENTGIAMVERSHGIERVGSMSCPSIDSAFGSLKIGVGVSETYTNASTGSLGDHLGRTIQFRSDGHHANLATRGLPEAFEERKRRKQ